MVRKTRKYKKRTKRNSYKNLKSIRRTKRTKRTKRTRTKRTKRSSYKNLRKRTKKVNQKGGATIQEAMDKIKDFLETKNIIKGYDSELGVVIIPGLRLFGLQYCLKEKYRIEGKIDKKLLELDTVEHKKAFLLEAFRMDPVKDVLRFTVIFDNDMNYQGKLKALNQYFKGENLSLHPQHEETPSSSSSSSSSSLDSLLESHRLNKQQFNEFESLESFILDETQQKALNALFESGGDVDIALLKKTIKDFKSIEEKKKIEKVFKLLDQDSDKNISEDELISFLKNNGITASETEIKRFFRNGDEDDNGKVNLSELTKLLTDSPSPSQESPPGSPPTSPGDVADQHELIRQKLLLFGEVECLRDTYIEGLFSRAYTGFDKMKTIFQGCTSDSNVQVAFKPDGGAKSVDRWHTDEPYKGINVVYLLDLGDSGNVVPVEIQYHTEESIKMKQKLHDLYEETQNLEYKITQNKKRMLSEFRTLKPPFDKKDTNKSLLGI